MRTHPFDSGVKHVAGELGHHHIANDHVELILENGRHLGAVGDGNDLVEIGLKESLIMS